VIVPLFGEVFDEILPVQTVLTYARRHLKCLIDVLRVFISSFDEFTDRFVAQRHSVHLNTFSSSSLLIRNAVKVLWNGVDFIGFFGQLVLQNINIPKSDFALVIVSKHLHGVHYEV